MGDDLGLRGRIDAFDFDDGAQPGYFTGKLAHENNWTVQYARRVTEEYRRFLYLTSTARHVVVPSDDVDQAWHQHLLDTEQYWETFCPNVLGRPLHHRPNKDGTHTRHLELYARTLATYALTFEHQPPEDIWPTPQHGLTAARRRPARRFALLAAVAVIAVLSPALVAFTAPGAATMAWPDMSNDATFKWMYLALAVAALGVSAILSRVAGRPWKHSALDDLERPLDPYEAAILDGVPGRAVSAAVAALVSDDSLRCDAEPISARRSEYRLILAGALRPDAHPLERRIYAEVKKGLNGLPMRDVYRPLEPDIRETCDSLRDRGFMSRQSLARRAVVVTPLLLVIAFGAVRIIDHGTTPLINATLAVLAVAAFLWLFIEPSAASTRTGDAALAAATDAHPEPASLGAPVRDSREVAWTVVLHGPAALVGGALGIVGLAILAPRSEGGGSGGSGGACGGGGGCSVGCGGGGCGGGCGGGGS